MIYPKIKLLTCYANWIAEQSFGASFGHRIDMICRIEVQDIYLILKKISNQRWPCNHCHG